LQDLNIKIQNLSAEVAELRKSVNISATKTGENVARVVEPITEATENLTSRIEKSKTVIFGEKKSWFRRLIDEFRTEVKK
jgi:hypothetical protein